VQGQSLASHSVNDGADIYNDILKSKFIINITVTATIDPIPIPITVLPAQDLLTIDNFYANNIGLVDSDTVFRYDLNDLPVDLGIPDNVTTTTTQEITDYTVAD
ncbi:MAG: hypothetical protein HRT68_10070, partial [Flavobacteriaceae bacterium]|nr:hypothetical protein [Flavobacteriaceae bacterium]